MMLIPDFFPSLDFVLACLVLGAVGGFIAIPALLVGYAIIRNVLPGVNWGVDELDRQYER